MDGIWATLAALERRHIVALRFAVATLPREHLEVGAWIEHALSWEEMRRENIPGVLLPPGPVMRMLGPYRAADVCNFLAASFVDSVQVRLFLAALAHVLLKTCRIYAVQ